MNHHQQLFSACTQTLDKPQQIAFIAAYFTTTNRHAEWLLEAYSRYVDECESEASTLNLANRLAAIVDSENQDLVSASL